MAGKHETDVNCTDSQLLLVIRMKIVVVLVVVMIATAAAMMITKYSQCFQRYKLLWTQKNHSIICL